MLNAEASKLSRSERLESARHAVELAMTIYPSVYTNDAIFASFYDTPEEHRQKLWRKQIAEGYITEADFQQLPGVIKTPSPTIKSTIASGITGVKWIIGGGVIITAIILINSLRKGK